MQGGYQATGDVTIEPHWIYPLIPAAQAGLVGRDGVTWGDGGRRTCACLLQKVCNCARRGAGVLTACDFHSPRAFVCNECM